MRATTIVTVCLVGLVLAWVSHAVAGENTYWIVDTGSYFDEGNWDDGLPTHNGFIINGGTAQIDSSGVGAVWQYVGSHQGTSGHLEMTAGDARITNLYLGGTGTATMVHTGGRLTIEASLNLGISEGGSGTYDISGTAELILTNDYSRELDIGSSGTGLFRQSGGLVSVARSSIFIGCEEGDPEGRYELSYGELIAEEIEIGYYGGPGVFRQIGGTCNVTDKLAVSDRYELLDGNLNVGFVDCRPGGLFTQSGGECVVETMSLSNGENRVSGGSLDVSDWIKISEGGGWAGGKLRVIGGSAEITTAEYGQGPTGILVSEVGNDGLSTIVVTGAARLDGEWEVVDGGAPFGRFDVLTADGGISGAFNSFSLPGPDWSWGIENDQTLWVEHVPEPATLSLLAVGAVALIRRRRK